jgi:nitroimidazol reductase NimA-like FMN-containing flavoprotein (pyridoxamine 5'-phosphate oxidase superfamily)
MARSKFLPSEVDFIGTQHVLRFNSLSEGNAIHSVPLCFAFDGTNFFVHARRVEAKRWKNVRENPAVSLELDNYSDDWSQVKGVLVQGKAEFLQSGSAHDLGLRLLKEKYPPYREEAAGLAPDVPIVKITPTRMTSWYLEGSKVPKPGRR